MAVSRFATENDLGRAMTHLAQRWAGSSTPVNMMHVGDLRLLLPLDGSAPQSAHMFYELRSLGYSLAVGWRCEPLAYGMPNSVKIKSRYFAGFCGLKHVPCMSNLLGIFVLGHYGALYTQNDENDVIFF